MNLFLRVVPVLIFISSPILFAYPNQPHSRSVEKKLAQLESSSSGRLGLSAINTSNHERIQYRGKERFPMGCTSKVIGVAAMLKKSMNDKRLLQEKIYYSKNDLTNWTPITQKHLSEGMTIEALSRAAIVYSDNTAMNLIANKIGGPQSLNHFAKSIGDDYFQLSHQWPDEARANPLTKEDSTTPNAMEKTLQKIILGKILDNPQREKLITWMQNNTTGDKRIRAGVPKNWLVGDKTGTGFNYGTTNDIAVIWPPHCKPIVITLFYSSYQKNSRKRDDLLAKATKIILSEFAKTDACIKQQLHY